MCIFLCVYWGEGEMISSRNVVSYVIKILVVKVCC